MIETERDLLDATDLDVEPEDDEDDEDDEEGA
jgi:hypothetical protein